MNKKVNNSRYVKFICFEGSQLQICIICVIFLVLFDNVLEPFANDNGCAIAKIAFNFCVRKNLAIISKSDNRFCFVDSSLMFIFESKIHTKIKLLGQLS